LNHFTIPVLICCSFQIESPQNPRGMGPATKRKSKAGTEVKRRFCRRVLELLLTDS
jgi:hypothetical protein